MLSERAAGIALGMPMGSVFNPLKYLKIERHPPPRTNRSKPKKLTGETVCHNGSSCSRDWDPKPEVCSEVRARLASRAPTSSCLLEPFRLFRSSSRIPGRIRVGSGTGELTPVHD